MKVHTEEENEQLGVPLNLGESLRSIRPEVEDTSSTPLNLGESLRSISPIEESAPEIVDTPTAPTPTTPDHIQFPGNPYATQPPVEPKIREFIPAVQKGWAGLQGNLGQISLDQSEWNKKHPFLAMAKFLLGPHRGEWAGFGIDERRFKEITTEVEKWNQEAESKGELMTTDDINGLGDWIDYFQTMLGSSGPQMGISILSGGTMTPLMMTAELNNNLKDIEGLSLDDRMALASGGGVISAALENLGLGFIIRGVPKEVVAKIGINKLSTILEKSVLVKAGAKVTGSGLAAMGIEGTTEGLQEAVAIISENLGGREFKPGEITYRLKQAVAAGMTVGGPLGGGASAARQSFGRKDSAPDVTSTTPVETPTLNLASIGKPDGPTETVFGQEIPLVGKEPADTSDTSPLLEHPSLLSKTEEQPVEDKPFVIAEKPTVETVKKAVPEESSTEQSTPVQEEAVSPTQKEQPVTKKKTKKSIEFELAKKQAKEKEAKAKREEAEAKKEVTEDEIDWDRGGIFLDKKEYVKKKDLVTEEVARSKPEGGIYINEDGEQVRVYSQEEQTEIDKQEEKDRASRAKKNREKKEQQKLEAQKLKEEEAKKPITGFQEVADQAVTDISQGKKAPSKTKKEKAVTEAVIKKDRHLTVKAPDSDGIVTEYEGLDDFINDEEAIAEEKISEKRFKEEGGDLTEAEQKTAEAKARKRYAQAVLDREGKKEPTQKELADEMEAEAKKVVVEPDEQLEEGPLYTVESEGKTVKRLTPETTKKEIEKSFGKSTVRKLLKNDGVTIFATQDEYIKETNLDPKSYEGQPGKGRKIQGSFHPSTGKVYLIAENIKEGEAGGVLLHEVGEHAALNEMVGNDAYESLSKNFEELLKAKDPVAVAASKRIPKNTPESHIKSEQLAYLVDDIQSKITAGEKVSSKARTLYNRVINLIRNWIRKLPAYRKFEGRAALKRLQKGELLTPENIASLARVAVDFHTGTYDRVDILPSPTKKERARQAKIGKELLEGIKERKQRKEYKEGTRVTSAKKASDWKKANKRPERKKARIDSPELQQAAEDLEAGEITFEEYQEKVDKIAPIEKFDKVPEPATNLEVAGSINEGQLKKGALLNEDGVIEDGDTVENRLDIPAYEDYDTWVATITPHFKGLDVPSFATIYAGTAKLINVTFKTQPSGSLKIAQGKGKYPLATMKGEWVNSTNEDLKAEADDLMNDPDWVQVGMNPERQSSFYAKEDKVVDGVEIKKGTPLASAEEVIQVGAFVLAKKPTTGEAQIVKSASKKTGEEIRFSEEAETDKPTTGININDSKQPFTKQIISGEKTIETRNTNSLKGQIGKRVGIIRTGKGKPQVVAYATVGEPIIYNTKEEFRKDQDKHLVEEGSEFDIKEDGMKYGYPLTDVKKVTPFPVTSKGIVSREIDQPPVKKEIEVDMEEVIDESQFAEVRKRFNEAKVKDKKANPLDTVKDVAERAKNIFTRSHPDLDPEKFGQTLEYIRQVQDVPSYAQWQTFQDIYEFIDKMTDAELEIFTYNIILPDMIKDLKSGVLKPIDGELPFGYESLEQVELDLRGFKQKARKTKTKSGKTVEKAVAERNEVMNNLKNELIDEGLLSEELRNDEAYYHHQVIQFMQMEDKFKGDFNVNAQKAGIRTKKQGWQKARTGSTKDYNTSYLDAEFAVMSMMRSQLETKKLLDKIEVEENKFTEIEAQAKEEETTVDDLLRNSEDWKDYTIWKPNPDSVWFHTYTLNDKVAQEVLEQVDKTDKKIKANKEALEKGEKLPKRTQKERTEGVEVTEGDIGEGIIKGKDEEWIIPKELAKTLNESRKPNEGIAAVSAWTLQAWKKWVLLNPERLIKYNLNNSSGDIDIAFAFDPMILANAKQAAKDLFHDLKKHKLSPELQKELAKWRKKGVVDSGFAITEVDDFSRMYEKLFEGRPSNMKDETWVEGIEAVADDIITGPKKLAKGYWKNAKDYTTLRENILRLAAVRYFEKKITENPKDKIYAASKSYEIDQIKDNDDRAAKLARELIGDYGNISHAGQFIREHLMPFWSWTEINTPRYIRLLANSAKETSGSRRELTKRIAKTIPGKAARTGVNVGIKAGVRMAQFAAMTTMVAIWNHTLFPDEEEKLSEFERGQLHILLPNIWQDGEVVSLRFSGAFSDALSWLSLHDSFSDYSQGKTIGEQFEEMWKAPINKLTGGLTPTAKVFYETATGVATWPDIFNPRPIRDRWRHIAKVFSGSIPYDWWTGKPSRGWGKNLSKLLLQSSDPGEAAYYKVRGFVRDFNDKMGDVSSGGFTPTDKGNALYYFKQSLRYGDMEAAERYLRSYVDLAGGPAKASKGLKVSIKRAAPMGGLKKRDREAWLKSLTQAELKTLQVARAWFKKVYGRTLRFKN